MELLTSWGTPRIHGSVTPRKIAERVRLVQSLGEGEPPLTGIKASNYKSGDTLLNSSQQPPSGRTIGF